MAELPTESTAGKVELVHASGDQMPPVRLGG
jgi:hypothetical protein